MLDGAGGTGKTFQTVNDLAYEDIVYVAHSHLLCSNVRKEFGKQTKFQCPYQWIICGNPEFQNQVLNNAKVLLFDEVSCYKNWEINKLMKFCKKNGLKAIFMGDIGYQTDPVVKNENPTPGGVRRTNFQRPDCQVVKMSKNYRFTCPIQNRIMREMR